MKLFFELFSIILFFIVYKMYDIYLAVIVLMVAYTLNVAIHLLIHRKVEKMQLATLGLLLILGGATLFFQNEAFIKWKPTLVYWLFAIVFITSHYIGNKPLIQRLMEKNIALPTTTWIRLSISWTSFFVLLGIANLFVAYQFDTDTWVNFKLFGILGLTLLFIIGQAVYMSQHLKPNKPQQ